MNKKGSLLFCSFNDCPQQLEFKTGWRKACHSKGKFYGALKHKCGITTGEVSCKHISRALAIEHKFKFVDKDSEEGKKLQKRLAGIEQTLYGFQKIQRSGRSDATSALNVVLNMCLTSTQTKRQSVCQRSRCYPACRAFVSHSLYAGCLANSHCGTQAIDREAHTERDELWANQLRSAACCLLGAHDGLEGQSILNQLVHEPAAVLANSDLNTCFCSLCRTSMTVMAYNVSRWQTGNTNQQCARQHHQCVCWLTNCCTPPQC